MIPDSAVPQPGQVVAFFQKHRTGLITLVFTDLVDSTALLQRLGDQAGTTFLRQRRQIVRDTLRILPEAEEIETAGDSFLLDFAKPSDAVRFALLTQARLRTFSAQARLPVQERIGIHLGEVVISEHETEVKVKDLYGIQLATCARVTSLAQGGQILLTRGVFDSARQVLKGEDLEGVGPLSWVSHGPYQFKGIEEAVEVCEVGEAGRSPLTAPPSSDKAQRQVRADEEPVLGWRPAVGQEVPNTKWVLEERLGEGGFGEAWVGRHQTMKERRVFKFCFRADRVRSLKREVTLFRLLKERTGEHPNIVRLYEVYFDQPPYYLEEDYVEGKDLRTWCEAQGGIEQVPLETRLEIVAQAAEALQAAHDAGIIHRDVKPGNILVATGHPLLSVGRGAGGEGSVRAKLTDFGIGQVVSAEYLEGVTRAGFTQTMLSSSASQTGTQLYLAPEISAGMPATTRSDLYSLGVVLYQLLIGDFGRPVTVDWQMGIEDPLLREDLARCFAWRIEDRHGAVGVLARLLRTLPLRRTALAEQHRKARLTRRWKYAAATFCGTTALALALALTAGYGLRRAHQAEQRAKERLIQSLIDQARAVRVARQEGYRETAFGLLAQASQLDTAGQHIAAMREEAGRCLGDFKGFRRLTIQGFEAPIASLALNADGTLLAAGLSQGRIAMGPPAEQARRIVVDGHRGEVVGLCFRGADSQLVSLGSDGTEVVWRITNGALERIVQRRLPHSVPIVGFDHEGQHLLAVDPDGKFVEVAPPGSQAEPFRFSAPELVLNSAAFSASRRLVAAGTATGDPKRCGVVLWDFEGRQKLQGAFPGMGIAPRKAISFSPDGSLIACGFTMGVWIAKTDGLTPYTFLRSPEVMALRFSPSGEYLVTKSMDGVIRIIRLATNHEVALFRQPAIPHHTPMTFSADGGVFASAGTREVHVWRLRAPPEVMRWTAGSKGIPCLVFTQDGKQLISASGSADVSLWETTTGKRRVLFEAPGTWIQTVAPDPLGTILAVGEHIDSQGRLSFRSLPSAAHLGTVERQLGKVNRVVFEPSGRYFAVCGDGVALWSLGTDQGLTALRTGLGKPLKEIPAQRCLWLLFSIGGRYLVWNHSYDRVRCLDLGDANASPTDLRGARLIAGWHGMAACLDHEHVAFVGYDSRLLEVWNLRSATRAFTLSQAGKMMGSFIGGSADGRYVTVVDEEGQVTLCDLLTKSVLLRLPYVESGIWSFAWDQSQQLLAVGSVDGGITLWRLDLVRRSLAQMGLDWR